MALNLRPGTPKCERCGIPCAKSKMMCDECRSHDEAVAAKMAAGWDGEGE